ncbi:hypothetical protein IscW_ISCW014420 [Ixodes scapularis]|uniref:Uncharacterized protein n=1 Tax=Ixodes scapularis TaxID=6945 RepID=B7QGQ6_IXOSC|nr:hypothetical protein IscW_ISCW014420 [Ixodes scapularis]|eukprot:XP_002400426.1 hypothetical protein IscW_ISCW014420 [Ixodes scapularis]
MGEGVEEWAAAREPTAPRKSGEGRHSQQRKQARRRCSVKTVQSCVCGPLVPPPFPTKGGRIRLSRPKRLHRERNCTKKSRKK